MAGILTHSGSSEEDLASALQAARARATQIAGSAEAAAPLLADLDEWSRSEFGRWMIINGGWNAHWTRHVIDFDPHTAGADTEPLEVQFMTEALGVLATRQRASIFTEILTPLVVAGTTAISVGCGYMDELLRLPQAPDAALLVGVDLDPEAIIGAQRTAESRSPRPQTALAVGDAWDLTEATVEFGDPAAYLGAVNHGADVLCSNGLNIYVDSDERTTDLYRSFRSALRTGGTAVVSAMTPPSVWRLDGTSREVNRRMNALMQMCDVRWANYRTPELTEQQLADADLKVTAIHWDDRHLYPTFVASAR